MQIFERRRISRSLQYVNDKLVNTSPRSNAVLLNSNNHSFPVIKMSTYLFHSLPNFDDKGITRSAEPLLTEAPLDSTNDFNQLCFALARPALPLLVSLDIVHSNTMLIKPPTSFINSVSYQNLEIIRNKVPLLNTI